MAIQNSKEKLTLRIDLDAGLVDGKQKIYSKSFTQIKTESQDTALYNTAVAIAGLQEKALLKVKRVEVSSIYPE